MDLSLLIDYVLPSNSVLYKHCNCGWAFYKDELAFEAGKEYMNQATSESLHEFLERVVQQLMKDEENDEERLVAIDYAIWANHKK
jgi:hypothetical protein